jgi:hypothetical protein
MLSNHAGQLRIDLLQFHGHGIACTQLDRPHGTTKEPLIGHFLNYTVAGVLTPAVNAHDAHHFECNSREEKRQVAISLCHRSPRRVQKKEAISGPWEDSRKNPRPVVERGFLSVSRQHSVI